MAQFHRGFVYEIDVASRLTIEGRVIPVEETSTPDDRRALAWKMIDDSAELTHRRAQTELQKLELRQDQEHWNTWRRKHPEIHPMLADADLTGWQLEGFDLSYANLTQARLQGANLRGVNFHQAILAAADLTGADLTGANFCRTDLYETKFKNARLVEANLQGVQLVRNDFAGATVVDCKVYGLSAWDLELDQAKRQGGFVIRYRPREGEDERTVSVNDLEMAGFTIWL